MAPGILIAIVGAPCTLGDPPRLLPKFFPPVLELSSLNGTNGFVLNGIEESDRIGSSVASAGDVNGDGIDDLIVGTKYASPNGKYIAGASYVVFGGSGVGAGGSIEFSALMGTNGFAVNGSSSGDSSGCSVAPAGDFNGDGVDDLIVGAWAADPSGRDNAGECYVLFGGSDVGASGSIELSSLSGTEGCVIRGATDGDNCGYSVSLAGDVNGDGFGDVIIGAPGAAPYEPNSGEVYIVFGGLGVGASGAIELSSLDGSNGFVLNGIDESDRAGWCVSSAGDANGDGIDDLIIGSWASPGGRGFAGETYVVFGSANVGNGGVIELASLDGINGLVLNGIDPGDFSGWSVDTAGDVNSDGIDDLIIGAWGADPIGRFNAGESYVVFGRPGLGGTGLFELSFLDGLTGFVLYGIDQSDSSGRSVSAAGDVNGDGIDDLIIGARYAEPNGGTNAGESYVVFGGPSVGVIGSVDLSSLNGINGFSCRGIGVGDGSGHSVSSAGDVNHDGVDDVIIGATFADSNGLVNTGQAYVVFGRRARMPHFCPADVDGDAYVSTADFNILVSHFGDSVEPGTLGDLTGDGVVNSSDFAILAADFGCGP